MRFAFLSTLCLVICTCCPALAGQNPPQSAAPQDVDFTAFVKETQQSPNQPGYVGIVWWIPTEYWVISAERGGMSEERAQQRYLPLKKYTVVAVAIGKIGIGTVNWLPETQIRDNVLLRDSLGNSYPAVQKLDGDAEGLAGILKPVFANILGKMGENILLLFFPASNKMAKSIADPLAEGNFSIVISKAVYGKEDILEWKLPLTTLSPPKYCPLGKERVQANWKYCPWHGVKLGESAVSTATVSK
jgi:hypothetical protein